MEKLISVVIPARNESSFIGRAIRSLVEQSLPRDRFEIIVVDNGSADDTAEQARQARVDKVVSESNVGTNFARARGLAEATAPLVAFLDADCQAPIDWLERLVAIFASRPEVVGIGGAYDLDFDSRSERFASLISQRYLIPLLIAVLSFFWKPAAIMFGGNWAARREVLQTVGIDTSFVFFGDDVAVALALAGKGEVLWDPTLTVKSSARRYREEGSLRLQLKYVVNLFSVYFRHRPINFRTRKR